MDMQVFTHEQFSGSLRAIIDEKGEPWFVAKDLAEILEYSETNAMTRKLDDDEIRKIRPEVLTGMPSSFSNNDLTLISESGLYSAILRSSMPKAKVFKRWVTGEVLPDIRKYGVFVTPTTADRMIADPDWAIGLLQQYKKEKEEKAKAMAERDEAVRTKAQISSKREASVMGKLSWQTRWDKEKEEYIAKYGREEYEKDCPVRCGGILFYREGRSPEALTRKLAEKEKAWKEIQKLTKRIQALDDTMRDHRKNH